MYCLLGYTNDYAIYTCSTIYAVGFTSAVCVQERQEKQVASDRATLKAAWAKHNIEQQQQDGLVAQVGSLTICPATQHS